MPEEFVILTQEPDWSTPIEERHEYLTDILSAYNSLEQRVQLRTLPRFRLKYRLLLPTAAEAAQFESDLWRLGARRVQVPLWPDATPLLGTPGPLGRNLQSGHSGWSIHGVESEWDSDHSGAKTIDENTGTLWSSANGESSWISFDFGAVQTFNEIALTARRDGYAPGGYPKTFDVFLSDDGTNWGDAIGSFLGPAEGALNGVRTFYDLDGTRTARYLKLIIHTTWSATNVCIGEFTIGLEVFLPAETAGRRFRADDLAMLWRDAETYEIITLHTVGADGLILASALAAEWPADGRTFLLPLLRARLEDAPEMARITSRIGAINLDLLSEGQVEDEGSEGVTQAAAGGHLTMIHSSPLGNWIWAAVWSSFSIPELPEDAVVQAIYAVAASSRIIGVDGPAAGGINAGTNLNPFQVGWTGYPLTGFGYLYAEWDQVFYVDVEQSALSWLLSATIYARLFATLGPMDLADAVTVTALGFAVYYTSATPGDDSSDLAPPVEVPEGQGVAWSYPSAVEARSWDPGASNGSAEGHAFIPYSPPRLPTLYRGFDVLDDPIDQSQDFQSAYRRDLHHLDPQTGTDAVWDRAGVPILERKPLRLLLEGREEIARALVLLARRRGALVPFWLPTWASDLQMSANLGAEDTELVVQDIGYAAGPFQSPARRFLAFILRDGMQYYREVWNAEPGAPGTEVLTLDEALPVALNKDRTLVSYLVLCRLAADDPGLLWQTTKVAEIALEVIEVPMEVPLEIDS